MVHAGSTRSEFTKDHWRQLRHASINHELLVHLFVGHDTNDLRIVTKDIFRLRRKLSGVQVGQSLLPFTWKK